MANNTVVLLHAHPWQKSPIGKAIMWHSLNIGAFAWCSAPRRGSSLEEECIHTVCEVRWRTPHVYFS